MKNCGQRVKLVNFDRLPWKDSRVSWCSDSVGEETLIQISGTQLKHSHAVSTEGLLM